MSGGSIDEFVLPQSSSITRAHVSYSCGSCAYELNLNSCNRNIPAIDAEYGKSIKRGVISFFSVDETRFTQINKLRWRPWRLFQRRTKLLCRNCGNYIGTARDVEHSWDAISARRMYEIRIGSLRPLSFKGSAFLLQEGF